jgi:hypothetical protein
MNWFLQKLPDISNIGHVLAGASFCYMAAYLVYRRYNNLGLGAVVGFSIGIFANLVWEITVDVWRVWPYMADSRGFDWMDVFVRGLVGSLLMALYFYGRGEK